MNEEERYGLKLHLLDVLRERMLSRNARRRRRFRAAWARFKSEGGSLAAAVRKNRLGLELSDDEFILTHLGFARQEREHLEARESGTVD
jgi:hypothetical protein